VNHVTASRDVRCCEGRLFCCCSGHLPAAFGIDLLEGCALCGKCAAALEVEFRKNVKVLLADIEFPEPLAEPVRVPGAVLLAGRDHGFEGVCRPPTETESGLHLLRPAAQLGAVGVRKKMTDGLLIAF
jgi:hypothetical protein